MRNGIHFISGLPRSGSTLLAAILRQNPRIHAAISSPVANLFQALLNHFSQNNEMAVFFPDGKRQILLKGIFENYYHDIHPTKIVIDTGRYWSSRLPAVAELFPQAKVIACVRHMPWIFDSFERLFRQNKFEMSKIVNCDPAGTVYSRVDSLANNMVGFARNALREAYYGEQTDRLMLLKYETLTRDPKHAIDVLYDFIGEKRFSHDFKNISYSENAYDAWLGTPGLHRVNGKVTVPNRQTILPPDLFQRFENDSFWLDPKQNPRGVRVV